MYFSNPNTVLALYLSTVLKKNGSTFCLINSCQGVHIHYTDLYASLVFLAAIYAGGLFTSRFLKMPSLVGEIFVGIFMGPNMLDYVPNEEAFVMLGEIG